MASNWDQALFDQWIALREKSRLAGREKNYADVVEISKKIIELSRRAPFIGIVVFLFERDIADAYSKLGDTDAAIQYYRKAISSLHEYRATKRRDGPNSFLIDLEKMEKKVSKLEGKK